MTKNGAFSKNRQKGQLQLPVESRKPIINSGFFGTCKILLLYLAYDGSSSTYKIFQDALARSCQNDRLARSCKHMHLAKTLQDLVSTCILLRLSKMTCKS